MRVIGKMRQQLGIMSLADAIQIAESEGAELVNIAPNAEPPIYRIIDPEEYRKIRAKRRKGK